MLSFQYYYIDQAWNIIRSNLSQLFTDYRFITAYYLVKFKLQLLVCLVKTNLYRISMRPENRVKSIIAVIL